jgi:hypothetical protein
LRALRYRIRHLCCCRNLLSAIAAALIVPPVCLLPPVYCLPLLLLSVQQRCICVAFFASLGSERAREREREETARTESREGRPGRTPGRFKRVVHCSRFFFAQTIYSQKTIIKFLSAKIKCFLRFLQARIRAEF